MNTKKMVKWGVVLFLLVALPVMTAALAQGEGPVAKQLPVVTEPGESAAPETYNVYESEANNTFATADWLTVNDVMGGMIGSAGDVDYFKFNMPEFWHGMILLDIEAASINSALDPVVCLYDNNGAIVACNDDSDGLDSVVFAAMWGSGGAGGNYPYYISVRDLGDNSGGSNHFYELIVSNPLLVSAPAAKLGTGNVAGIPFQSQDILAFSSLNTGDEKWIMFFDGSDVGLTKNVTNVAAGHWKYPEIFISLMANQNVPGVGTVKPQDVIQFNGQFGPTTSGTFTMYLRGSEWDLTKGSEKIDAFGTWTYGVGGGYEGTCWGFPISMTGAATVSRDGATFKFADEDVACMEEFYGLQGWRSYFDGSMAAGLAAEDVNGVSMVDRNNQLYLNILGKGNIAGHAVTQKDIFAVNYPAYTWGGFVWRGPEHGWNYDIDAFEYKGW